jgi:ribosome-associated protein
VNTITETTAELQLIVDALDDKRAKDIAVLDLSKISATLDYFVVATGESGLQLKALEDGVRERLKQQGVLARGIEAPSNRWILLDFGHVVVHIMSPEARNFYDLEGLWADAERLEVKPS